MNLNLTRPIVFFDLESTGTSVTLDRIVELSYLKVYPDGRQESQTFRVNPVIPIRPEATAVHGISDDDVKDCPLFRHLAPQIAEIFKDSDLGGYNSNRFDLPMLAEEMIRSGVEFDFSQARFVDVQVIFHKMEQRTLSAAYKFYCQKDLKDAHSAQADTNATYEVLLAQLDRYDNLRNDVDFLSEYTSYNRNVDFAGRMIYNEKNEPVFNFGKYKDQKVVDVLRRDPGYFDWIQRSEFPLHTKNMLRKIKEGMK